MLCGGIERYEARIVQRPVTVLETSRKVTFANIVGVVKKDKVLYKPLEPDDDNSDPKEDPKEATGCWSNQKDNKNLSSMERRKTELDSKLVNMGHLVPHSPYHRLLLRSCA